MANAQFNSVRAVLISLALLVLLKPLPAAAQIRDTGDKYAYGTLGFPFMKKIGQAILDYERSRKKKIKPDLSGFRCDYSADQDIFPPGKKPSYPRPGP